MELIFNELSVHGQFADLATFRAAISRVMGMRRLMQRCGRELYCHRGVVASEVMQGMTMPQAVQALDLNSRRALMQWLTRHGPFWEDAREHGGDDYLDCFKYEDHEALTLGSIGSGIVRSDLDFRLTDPGGAGDMSGRPPSESVHP